MSLTTTIYWNKKTKKIKLAIEKLIEDCPNIKIISLKRNDWNELFDQVALVEKSFIKDCIYYKGYEIRKL